MELKVTYNDETSKIYYFNYYDYPDDWDFFLGDVIYSGDCMDDGTYFTPHSGENTITITYGDKSVDFKFTALEVKSIKINSSPYYNFIPGINYYLMYYLYGLEITAEYSDNSTEIYKFDNDWDFFYNELKYSGKNIDEEYGQYITPELGENTITITYGNASADFTISAFNVESMELVKSPTGTFIAGEEYDPDYCFNGIQVRVNYSNDTTVLFIFNKFWYFFQEELEFSSASIDESGYLIPVVGENKITATCDGKTFDFVIYADNEVDSIEITSQPTYTEFIAGEEYNIYDILTGMGLTVNYVSEGTKTYTYEENEDLFRNLKFSGDSISEDGTFTPSVGENVITVTYQEKTTELKFTGVEPEPVIISMEITAPPAQTEFTVGNEYNIYDILAGMEVTLNFSNYSTQVYTYENNREFFETLKFSGDCIGADGKFTPVLGENVITVAYEEFTAELKLTGIEESKVILGDVDGDGELTVKDATYIQMYLAKLISEDELNLNLADYNDDGDINIRDVTIIQLKLANLV